MRPRPPPLAILGAGAVLLFAAGARAQGPDAPMPRVLDRALAPPAGGPVRWPRRPLIDRATAAVGAPAARARFDTTGAGATVCLVDSGLDLHARGFRDRDGRTRVRWMLDLTSAPRGVTAPDLESRFGGAVWDADEIDAALAAGDEVPGDPHGHGTAVAALAAGDDADDGSPGPQAGVAPEADLVVVRALRPGSLGFADADLIAGVQFCWWVAGRGARPTEARRTVVVLALGGHDGAHDGSEPLERAVEEVSHAGLLVVAAAGNDGDAAVHAAGWLAGQEVARVPVRVPEPSPGERYVSLVVETPLPGPVAAALVAPDGTRTPFVSPGESVARDHAGGRLAIDGERTERDATTRVLYAVMSGGGDVGRALGGGRYAVELRGPGRFELWLAGADLGATLLPPALEGPFVVPGAAVTIPATAPSAIAVGASVSRAELEAEGGTVRARERLPGVASFSAAGPAPSGAPKPDLMAPGGVIATVLSGDVDPSDPDNLFGGDAVLLASRRVGDDRIAVTGTSFAAPVVAGALALALALEPSRGEEDRALLSATAARMVDASWTADAGAGELRVESFLEARGATRAGTPDPASSDVGFTHAAVSPGAHDLWLRGTLLDASGRPSSAPALSLRTPGGEELRLPVVGGVVSSPLPPPRGRVGDTLVYRARADGVDLGVAAVRLHVDLARDRHPVRAGGAGCAVAGAGAPCGVPPWLTAVLLPLLLRRRSVARRSARSRSA